MSVLFTRRGEPPETGKRASDYSVGDSVYIPINGTNTEFLVVHQGNPSSSIYPTTCDGTWLLSKYILETQRWHTWNVNDYANSAINSYLNGTFYGSLSTAAKSAIKQVKIPYRPSSGTSQTCSVLENGLSTKVFLLSCNEVGLTTSDERYITINEGSKLSYFENGRTTSANNKRKTTYNGSYYVWFTRSPYCYESYYVGCVETDGSFYYYAAAAIRGIRPAFIIKSDTLFDKDTNVIKG